VRRGSRAIPARPSCRSAFRCATRSPPLSTGRVPCAPAPTNGAPLTAPETAPRSSAPPDKAGTRCGC
jgi:hypothetical protein